MFGIYEPEENFPDLSKSKSILKEVLTQILYGELAEKKTETGYTLDEAIQIGVDDADEPIGFTIGDQDTIETFEPLISKIVSKYHNKYFLNVDSKQTQSFNTSNLTIDKKKVETLNGFVISYSFQLRRNLYPYTLPARMTRAERRSTNVNLLHILKRLVFDPELPWGKDSSYGSTKTPKEKQNKKNSSKEMNTEIKKQQDLEKIQEKTLVYDMDAITDYSLSLLEDLHLYQGRDLVESQQYLITGISRDFPDGRSIFYNSEFDFSAYTNHDNHLNMIIQTKSYDINLGYTKFIDIYRQLRRIMKNKEMKWIRNAKYGYVTTSLQHIGTGLTIDICIKAKNLIKYSKRNQNEFNKLLKKRDLKIADFFTSDEEKESKNDNDIIWLQTTNSLGLTECDIVRKLSDSLFELAAMEKKLKKNESIKKLI